MLKLCSHLALPKSVSVGHTLSEKPRKESFHAFLIASGVARNLGISGLIDATTCDFFPVVCLCVSSQKNTSPNGLTMN